MHPQLEIAYFIFAFAVGLLSLGIAVFFHMSRPGTMLRPFLLMFGAFTLMNITNFITSYMRANIPGYEQPLYYILLYLENPVLLISMIFLLPHFVHSLVALDHAERRSRLFGLIAVATFVIYAGIIFISVRVPFGEIGSAVKNGILGIVMLYSWIVLFRHPPKTRSVRPEAFRRGLWASLLVIPLILHDMFLLEATGIKFFPLVYALTGVLLVRYYYIEFFRDGSAAGAAVRPSSAADAAEDDAFPESMLASRGLSAREIEVVRLLAEGKSYRQIGEELFISLNTVKAHIRSIYPKMGVSSRHEIVRELHELERSHPG